MATPGANDVQREIVIINEVQIPPSGQGQFVQLVTPEAFSITEQNSGQAVVSVNPSRTGEMTINTSQNIPAARILGALWEQQVAALNARAGLPNGGTAYPFRYVQGNGTITTGTCLIRKPADPTGAKEDVDVTWVITVFGAVTLYSTTIPAAPV